MYRSEPRRLGLFRRPIRRVDPFEVRLDDELREVPVNWVRFTRELNRRLAEDTSNISTADSIRRLGSCAYWCRVAGYLEVARSMALAAIADAAKGERVREEYVNRIRLADIVRAEGNAQASHDMALHLVRHGRDLPSYARIVDLAHFAAGSAAYDLGDLGRATAQFEEALRLREARGASAMVTLARQALNICAQRERGRGHARLHAPPPNLHDRTRVG